ncbi:hypothetical protein [Streptomyces sp. NPDC002276]
MRWPAEELARMCVLLEAAGPPLSEGAARAKAEETVAAVRDGADAEQVVRLLGELDHALRMAGYAAGLGRYRTASPPPASGTGHTYQPLGGPDEHPFEEVLACPGENRCMRAELPEWGARITDPVCTVHERPLVRVRTRP